MATARHASGSCEHSRRSPRCGIALICRRAPGGVALMRRAVFPLYIRNDKGGPVCWRGTIMKLALLTTLLCGAAAVTTACASGSAPNRAVVPSAQPVVLTMANGLSDPDELSTFVREVSALT